MLAKIIFMPIIARFEKKLLGALAVVCLAPWLIACVTDVNHPPGARMTRLIAAIVVIGLGLLERYRAWWGFYVFLALWPHALVIQELLIKYVSPIFTSLPQWWAGPTAAALTLGYLFRIEKTRTQHPSSLSVPSSSFILHPSSLSVPSSSFIPHPSSFIIRIGLWLLIFIWIAATIGALFRTAYPGLDWKVECADMRHLLLPGPFSSLYPLLWTLDILPSLVLGLALLLPRDWNNADSRLARAQNEEMPINVCVWIACASGAIVAAYLLSQQIFDWHWSFDMAPPSGSFPNRNTTAPFLVITAALTIAATYRANLIARIGAGLISFFQALIALTLGTRNAWLMIAALLAMPLLRLKKWARLGVCVSLITICVGVVLWAPLNKLSALNPSPSIHRILTTIEGLRNSNLKQATGDRQGIYQAAWEIFKTYPIIGSGPGTIRMLTHGDSRFGAYIKDDNGGYPFFCHAHSMPLHLLAECGFLGMASWVLLWLALPILAIIRWKSGWLFAAVALVAGLGNISDACWFTPGMTTFCALLLVWAFCGNARKDDSVVSRNSTNL